MILDIFMLVLGAVLVLVGASWLTDGASDIARRLGVSDLVVGMTVIGLGTSMPEFSVSLLSALKGSTGMAIGNIIGSNIFNITVIMGLTAMVLPVKVDHGVIYREMPLLVVSALLVMVMGNSVALDGSAQNILTRVDGLILLLFFVIYMWLMLKNARSSASAAGAAPPDRWSLWRWAKCLGAIIVGLAFLIFGADRFVVGAKGIARAIGISDAVIGLTIVAAGTSLPELAASVASAIKGKPGLAIGNVIGSNLFNTFLVLGATATIHPLPFGGIGGIDLLAMLVATLLFWVFARYYRSDTITRPEGALLFAIYIAYTILILS